MNLTIGGMSCGHCVSKVSKALTALPGVVVHSVEIGSASVSYEPAATSPEAVARAVEGLGYAADVPRTA
ncbi:MAG: heavy-metal-associated domain-containing protein [Vicinamibacteria bacterium]